MSDRSRNLGQIVMGLNRAQQKLTLQINQALAPFGLNMTRLTLLSRFTAQPNRSRNVSNIVQATGMNQPTVTKVVSQLIEQQWLVIEPDLTDARKKALRITPDGLGIVIQAYGKLTQELADLFSGYDDREIAELLESVVRLNENLET